MPKTPIYEYCHLLFGEYNIWPTFSLRDAVIFPEFFRVTLSVPYMLQPIAGYPENPNSLGEHIRKRRIDLGLFQREVAEKIGVRECTIYNWERGMEPELRYMPKILDFLDYVPFNCPSPGDAIDRLAFFKLVNGLNYRKLGELTGIHYEQLTDWLGRKVTPSRKSIERINKFLSTCLGHEKVRQSYFGGQARQAES